MPPETTAVTRIGDLISISPAPAVVSLTDLERLRRALVDGHPAPCEMRELLAGYCLDDPDTRAAFEVMAAGLAREQNLGDAFHVQGVYGAGKSHLLAVLALLAGHPEQAWPAFLETHPGYAALAPGFVKPRLVVAIALDEYPTKTHPLEYVVLSRLEQELAARHGVRAALTEGSHLLELVARYLRPQLDAALDEAAARAAGLTWDELRQTDLPRAAAAALELISETGFPLDWRRSRTQAWAELHHSLKSAELDGVVVLLDELGLFLAGKDRAGLNADASFLQWLAQRTAAARAWLVCATQRGIEEAGDIDRRTLRQLRDRFRAGFTLDLAGVEWVVEHKLVRRRDEARFAAEMELIAETLRGADGESVFSARELGACYPINPLCLQAIRRAAERSLSRTRSVVKLLQESARDDWLELSTDRLITPDGVFDILRAEMEMSAAGRKHLQAYEAVMNDAVRIARGQENELAVVMKALCLLGLGDMRWSERELRASLVGCETTPLWREEGRLRSLLQALYQRGTHVERRRREPELGDEYFLDVASDAAERLRQRLGELLSQLALEDERVTAAALQACGEAAFPLASLVEPRSLPVFWSNARRLVTTTCCDFHRLGPEELLNQLGYLASPLAKEDAGLFLASPTADPQAQHRAWLEATAKLDGRFSAGLIAWLPAPLSDAARERLVEHAALTMMVSDRTLFRRGEGEFRTKVRERWAASEQEIRRLLQRAYYEGGVIGAEGHEVLPSQRLWSLFGDWEGTLSEIIAGPLRRIFPRFGQIAPQQRLTGRVHTNQIIDQFIRPGGAALPPASTLEGHLRAYAAPLGLVEGDGRHPRVGLGNPDLVQAVIACTPARGAGLELDPRETIALSELTGKLAKSEWGLVREQAEMLVAALMRTGHLVGLDAFLLPLRLEQVAAPLADSLPYIMRGRALDGRVADVVTGLWQAAAGRAEEWSLPAQERAWGFFLGWAPELAEGRGERRDAIAQAAADLAHHPEEWDWAREALETAEALALAVDGSLSSRDGLTALASAAERLPGGCQQARKRLAHWHACERYLGEDRPEMARLRRLLSETSLGEADGLLSREQRAVLEQIGRPEQVVFATDAVKAALARWLTSYRKHYLAWHERAHAASRFDALTRVRRSAEMEVVRRLAAAGLGTHEAAVIEAELGGALARRCLAGDPLPEMHTVCPLCGLGFKQQVELPDTAALRQQAEAALARQWGELLGNREVLMRRAVGCGEAWVKSQVERLLAASGRAEDLVELLTEELISWLRPHLSQPKAGTRDLTALVERLRGKELTRQEVLRIVSEWLGGEGDEFIEIV